MNCPFKARTRSLNNYIKSKRIYTVFDLAVFLFKVLSDSIPHIAMKLLLKFLSKTTTKCLFIKTVGGGYDRVVQLRKEKWDKLVLLSLVVTPLKYVSNTWVETCDSFFPKTKTIFFLSLTSKPCFLHCKPQQNKTENQWQASPCEPDRRRVTTCYSHTKANSYKSWQIIFVFIYLLDRDSAY